VNLYHFHVDLDSVFRVCVFTIICLQMRNLAERLECLTANPKVLGSIPATLDIVESEGRQMK
jgi:hypothetical protein